MAFDPLKPFQTAQAPAFDPTKPFNPASPPPKRSDADVRGSPAYQANYSRQGQQRREMGQVHKRGGETVGRVPILGPVLQGINWATGGAKDPELNLSASDFAVPLPVMDEISGAGAAGVELVKNIGRAVTGRPLGDVRAAYLATKDEEEDAREEYRRRHPVATGTMEVLSSLGAAAGPRVAIAAAPRAGSLAARTQAAANAARTATASAAARVPGATRAAQAVRTGTAAVMNPANKAPAARIARAATTVAKGGAAGGVFGAAHEFADAEGGLGERLEAAKDGIVPGAAAGALVTGGMMAAAPVVVNTARGLYGLARDAGRRFVTPPIEPGAPLELLPTHVEEAGDVLERMLRSKGLDSEPALAARHADDFASDPSATTANLLGREGVGYVTALTRRPGSSGDAWQSVYEAARTGNPDFILSRVDDQLGVRPEFAAGDVDSMVDAGRKAAAEKYDLADLDAPLVSVEAEGFLRNPVFQRALARAKRIARLEGRDPYGLGLTHMDRTIDDGLPRGAELAALTPEEKAALGALRSGDAGNIRQGPSLWTWLRSRGGLNDVGGDFRAMGVNEGGKGRLASATGRGLSPDDAAPLEAWEAGYFPDLPEPPTREQFSEAVRRELGGRPIYARPNPEREAFVGRMDDMEQRLRAMGLDPAAATDAEVASAFARQRSLDQHDMIGLEPVDAYEQAAVNAGHQWADGRMTGAPGPQVEPVPTVTPTTRTWDYLKRGLDDEVKDKYMVRTGDQRGQLDLDDEGRALIGAMKQWRDGLRELNPKWGEALDTAGDYLSIQEAFGLGKGKLLGGGSVQAFGKWYASLPQGAQRDAVQAAFASDILDAVNRGGVRNGRFTVPGVMQKLELVFGRNRAAAFVRSMEARGRVMNQLARMAPNNNSTSGDALNFGQAVDQAGDPSGIGEASAKAVGRGLRGNVLDAVVDLTAGNAMRLLSYARTSGQPVQVRDEVGRLLTMSADDLRAWLLARQAGRPALPPPPDMISIGGAAGAQYAGAVGGQ